MPVIKPTKHTAPVIYPESNYRIAKYLDLTKFALLLSIKSLFFCRLDKLEDHFEGAASKTNFERRKELYRTQHFRSPKFKKPTEEEIEKNVKEHYEADWHIELIKDMCDKFGLKKENKKSELAK